jgi:hypothetical protein
MENRNVPKKSNENDEGLHKVVYEDTKEVPITASQKSLKVTGRENIGKTQSMIGLCQEE